MTRLRGRATRNHNRRVIARRNSRSMVLITLIVLCFVLTLGVLKFSLKRKEATYLKQGQLLEEQIKQEEARADELNELEEYMNSDRYVEDTAMEKLGMAYPDDILLKTR